MSEVITAARSQPIRSTHEPPITRREVAAIFRVHVNTVDNWVRRGCPSHTWGMRTRRFYETEVRDWLHSDPTD